MTIFFLWNRTSSVVLLCSEKMSLLDERVQRATSLLSPSHCLLPRVKEDLFPAQNDAKKRYQYCAFTQGFAIVVEKNDLKNGVYILDCSRHRKDTKNTRKKETGSAAPAGLMQ